MLNSKRINELMSRAVEESLRADASVHPNPRVGAVVFTPDGRIVSTGYHSKFGEDHAEMAALRKVRGSAAGLCMAVTLEPCNSEGKTPACSKLIVKHEMKKVYVGTGDTNPGFAGGASYLRKHGVMVEHLTEFDETVREINRFFFHSVEHGLPWVTVKAAVSFDGRTARKRGTPTKITCQESDRIVHAMRAEHMSVGVGAGTVNSDNPRLTVRHVRGRSPRPVIFSGCGTVDTGKKLLNRNPIIFTAATEYRGPGDTVYLPPDEPFITRALEILHEQYGINSIFVEGGTQLLTSFLRSGHIDELHLFKSPDIFGSGPTVFAAPPREQYPVRFALRSVSPSGDDAHLHFRRRKK